MLSLYQKLDEIDQIIVAPILQNNCYFSHPENILLAAVGDDDKNVRKFAYDKISRARSAYSTDKIHCFDKTSIQINFTAAMYINMIDWENVDYDLPPLLHDITQETIASNERLVLPRYPCHSQHVEKNVKDVTAANGKVYGHDSRHGLILQMKKSRLQLPKVESKADFLQ